MHLSKKIFALLLIQISVLKAHAHSPSKRRPLIPAPVNIKTNNINICALNNHQGFGHIEPNLNNPKESLRRQCLEESVEFPVTNCSDDQIMSLSVEHRSMIFSTINSAVRSYLEEYFKDFLATELRNLRVSVPQALKNCIDTPDRRNELHATELRSSHELDNMLSAIVLNEIYNFNLEKGQLKFRPYIERLSGSFPILYFSKSSLSEIITGHRGTALKSLLQEKLGEQFKVDNSYNGREHNRIMTLISNAKNEDPSFYTNLLEAHSKIKEQYAEEIKVRMKAVCDKGISPFNLKYWYPQVFNQAILDMSEKERATANLFLCRRKWYYQKTRTDTDCDGIKDIDDPSPNNPFSPSSERRHYGEATHNPPYTSRFNYTVRILGGRLILRTDLAVSFNKLSDQEQKKITDQINACKENLGQSMKKVFNRMKEKYAYYKNLDFELDINFYFEEGSYGDFKIHKCYCADCINVPDPDNPNSYIPQSTCKEDLSAAQK